MKLGRTLLTVAAIGLGGYGVYRLIKHVYNTEKASVKKQFEDAERKCEESGIQVSENTVAKDIINDQEAPLTKRLYELLLKCSNWDLDDLKGEEAVFGPSDDAPQEQHDAWEKRGPWNLIHVLQESPRKFGGQGHLHFFIQVPPYLGKTPLPSEYLATIREAVDEFRQSENIPGKIRTRYRGFWSYIGSDIFDCNDGTYAAREIFQEISEEEYSVYSKDGKPDGLGRMITAYYKDDMYKLYQTPNLESVNMFVDVSFPIETPSIDGMSIIQASAFLKKLLELDIQGEGPRRSQTLGPVVFHPSMDLGVIYADNLTERMSLYEAPEPAEV